MPDPVGVTPIQDFRQHVVRNTFAPMYLAYVVGGSLIDLRGALESGSYQVCYTSGRRTILGCLAVLSMANSGNVHIIMDAPWYTTYDYYKGVPPEWVERALALMNRCAACDSLADFNTWMVDLEAFVQATEKSLELRFPLPTLHSATGFFGSLRLGRQWLGILGDLGLPNPIPKVWTAGPAEEGPP